MRNPDVARVMEEIGGLMRLRGDNPFKIRAYRSAADPLAAWPDPIARLLASSRSRGELARPVGELDYPIRCRLGESLQRSDDGRRRRRPSSAGP